MLEKLRSIGSVWQIAIIILVVVLAASWTLLSSGFLSSGRMENGVLLSTGPVSASGVCGGTQQIASVRLSTGRVVHALVVQGGPITPGTVVVLHEQSLACNLTGYEIVGRK